MRIDSHVYCLPPRLRKSMELPDCEHQVRRAIHDHPEGDHALSLSSPEAILSSMDRCGLDYVLLVAFPWKDPKLCRETNDFLLNLIARQKRFHCLCAVQPADKNFTKEADRCLRAGALGLKINPIWQGNELDGPEFDELAVFAGEAGVPVMTHVDQSYKKSSASAAALLKIAKRHPETKFLAAHLGGLLGLYAQHLPIRKAISNIWFDTAVSSTMQMVEFYVQSGLEDKVLFGTDFPFNHCHNQSEPLAAFHKIGLSKKIADKILHGNYESFFNLTARLSGI